MKEGIIKSLLQNDLYKFSMQRCYFRKFNDVWARYEFRNRTPNAGFTFEMVDDIREEINKLCDLKFSKDEIDYIASIPWMKDAKGYIEFLSLFHLNRRYIEVMAGGDPQNLNLVISAEGPVWSVSMFEIYVLTIVNTVYYYHKYRKNLKEAESLIQNGFDILEEKMELFYKNPFFLMEFGTRRCLGLDWQEIVVEYLTKKMAPRHFLGTSNVYLAKKFNIKPLGTMAHEYLCLPQGLNICPVAESQKVALNAWMEEYRGELGTALTDTLGIHKFLEDFDKLYANAFTGVRHDSGDPISWGYEMIKHYKDLGIDPKTKVLVFSDSLDFPKAIEINSHFQDRAMVTCGIGTDLVGAPSVGLDPINIVMKLTSVNGHPVAKLSDDNGKTFGNDDEYIKYLKKQVGKL